MLQALRDNLKGTFAILIVGLMAIPFVLFGVDSLFMQDSSTGNAAEVNDTQISELQLLRAVRLQKQQLLERFGDQAPPELLSEEALREPVLNRLVQRELLRQAAEKGGLTISNAELDKNIVQTVPFQENGSFSPQRFTQLLGAMGYTPASYKAQLREDVIVSQLGSGIVSSSLAAEAELYHLAALTQQQRSFYTITLPYEPAAEHTEVSAGEINDYYSANGGRFMAPEQVSVEYIELSLDDLAANTPVDPADVKAQYDAEVANFEKQVQRHVAHILIEPSDEASDKIAAVQKRLDAGESFEQVVKELSEDAGSRDFGGDLGMTDGTSFPEAFETAAANLEVGQVSGPVETDAGTHFIKLLNVQSSEPPTFEEAEERIRDTLARAAAESVYAELLNELPDATYNAASLVDAAGTLGVEAKESELFDRRGGEGVLSNNQVLGVVFSDEVLQEGVASDVIEVGDSHVVVVKLKQHIPAQVKPLEEVQTEIADLLTRQKVEVAHAAEAADLIAKLQQGSGVQDTAEAQGLQWQAHPEVARNSVEADPGLLQHVFELPKPATDSAVTSQVTLDNGDTVVIQLTVVKPGQLLDFTAEEMVALQQRFAQEMGNVDMVLFQNALQSRADVEIY
ncbi:SurA N-terminal domain-containing protein [Pseudomaricurvus sp. HS19]|uniref:SurA N-terminal domain-containing protein n=1 Tax=Pseudomaricurvus sp. HS19 TaxID=2692626 RepID=UPI00136EF8B6|nr:SurA N-terminal domain-containing protein [Pseudomaricurvus sp. HS19]MYM62328.1 hypothetical protein [Pseudomaricurvus sp. HS19]